MYPALHAGEPDHSWLHPWRAVNSTYPFDDHDHLEHSKTKIGMDSQAGGKRFGFGDAGQFGRDLESVVNQVLNNEE